MAANPGNVIIFRELERPRRRWLPRDEAWIVLVGVAASAVALAAIALLIAQRGIGRNYASYDLSAYVEAARRLRDGAPLYPQLVEGAYRLGEVNLYLYPPPVALLFTPALLVSLPVASTIWGIALTALALAVAAAIAAAVAPARRPLAFAMCIGAFPLQWELANGNLTLVTLALALLAWRGRTAWRAAAPLGLAMGLKLLAVPMALTLAAAGRRRLLALTGALLGAVVLVTWPFLGGAWLDWIRLSYELAAGPQTRSYNVVPDLLRTGAGRALLVAVTVVALVVMGVLVRTRRLAPTLGFSAALCAAPYMSAFVFYPYAILVLPVLVWIGLGAIPLFARVAALAAWILIDLQAFDPDTVAPTALLGTAVAVGATIAMGLRTPSRPPLPVDRPGAPTGTKAPSGANGQNGQALRPVLSVVIPSYNEISTIGGVVKGHRDIAARIATSFEIIVCDDGSTDGTGGMLGEVARDCPELTILTNTANLGIPATMRRLYDVAQGEWIYFAPGDGQVPASALEAMWPAREGAALVVGWRRPRRDPWSRVLVAELYSAGLRSLFRLPVHDIDSVKLYRAADLRSVAPRSSSNFMEAEILIGLHRAGRPIREVVVGHRPRIAGRAKGVTIASALHAIADLALFALRDVLKGRPDW